MKVLIAALLLMFSVGAFAFCSWQMTNCDENKNCISQGTASCRDLGCHASVKPNGKVDIYRGTTLV